MTFRIGAGFEEHPDDRGVAALRGQPQRGGAEPVGGVDVRTRLYQQPRSLDVAPVRGPVQRGRTVALRNVRVGICRDQRTRFGKIA